MSRVSKKLMGFSIIGTRFQWQTRIILRLVSLFEAAFTLNSGRWWAGNHGMKIALRESIPVFLSYF